MSSITIDDVKRLADLSALTLSDQQALQFKKQLEDILAYVEQLNEVDTRGLEPTYQVTDLVNVTREDVVDRNGLSHEELMSNVPDQHEGQIKVKKIL